RRRHTRWPRDWSSDVCSSDLVRAYHGKRTIPKAYVTRMHLAAPATTDYWVNDQRGDPLFVVTADANPAMTRMLVPVLSEVRQLQIGRASCRERVEIAGVAVPD